MSSPLLEIEDLRVSFTQYDRGLRRRVVEPVTSMSLDVAAGELVALVGSSGAGKSLLGHAVLGILPPNAATSGSVRWRGEAVDESARRALAGREIALLPQSLSHLDPTATVGRQVRRSARLAGRRSRRQEAAVAAIDEVGLDVEVARRYPHQLSGGMGRRVLTAMAMLGEPSLIIADEPTPGLHPDAVAAVLDRLRAVADAGTGVLLITHDLVGALRVADRVVVCDRGRTLEEAPRSAFSGDGEALAHPYSRALWVAQPANGLRLAESTDAVDALDEEERIPC